MEIIKNTLFDQTHSWSLSNHVIKKYAYTCECMTYLYLPHRISTPMASMNGHVNEWHGIKTKENPNLAYKG